MPSRPVFSGAEICHLVSKARSSGFCTNSASEQARGDGLQQVHPEPLGRPVVLGGVEAMDGVDHQGDPGEPTDYPPVDAWLGVVGVEDVGPNLAEDAPQRPGGSQVVAETPTPCRSLERDEPDARGDDLVDERSGRRDPVCLAVQLDHRAELGKNQEAEAHVDGGEVGHPHVGPSWSYRRSNTAANRSTASSRVKRDRASRRASSPIALVTVPIGGHLHKDRRKCVDVTSADQLPGAPVDHGLAHSSNVEPCSGDPGESRLEHRPGKPLGR